MDIIVKTSDNFPKTMYPILKSLKGAEDRIVLFINKREGFVVSRGDDPSWWSLGYHSTDWLEDEHWVTYSGKLELCNG